MIGALLFCAIEVSPVGYRLTFNSAGSHSSPRSIVTPLGPDRLTLPPGQHAPNLSRQADETNPYSAGETSGYDVQLKRPGSSRFVE